ncbi:uncharacterized protein K452DRAFT_36964 [Aplosporella prunicola CBS 121167]|uniref:Uncharacterized protein n=1 Tax=Aplosporella prunicola CBS 121167 TaxID=1176127 RepID=A0A6A6BB19_9PEZI|nr:uncharacterized protein K452DRAFT_36964 [Aplosporella prunicola CBS 121167]KAF2141236.1 hypothetical protein K452DRAFT_36964 [Aplosporella prunicola CBS 121167]
MRTLSRFHALAGLAVCCMLYVGWIVPSLHVRTRVAKALDGTKRRVVVFGDSWSDTGEYRVAVPATGRGQQNASRPLWTEALCSELVCDYIDNFARSSHDAVLDVDVFANATGAGRPDDGRFVADLKAQVQQWLAFEKQKAGMPGRGGGASGERTLFTLFFGINDMWAYAGLEQMTARAAVRASMETLVAQLDVLAENTSPMKVVLVKVPDITFLPGFDSSRSDQRACVWLAEEWNAALVQAAAAWKGGAVHLLELDEWLLDRIREQQTHQLGITAESGVFAQVRQPCVNASSPTCSDEPSHLFWDPMHLSGRAHALVGAEAAALVARNDTLNHAAFLA